MPTLPDSKHERFAQAVAKGVKHVDAYVQAGYAVGGARFNAHRLITNDHISKRIKEIQTRVSEAVIAQMTMDRTRRVAILEDSVNRKLALREFRATMYGHKMGEERTIQVANATEEKQRRAEGFGDPPADILLQLKWEKSVEPTPIDGSQVVSTEYPKVLHHPGYPMGGSTGLLVKDYRGKHAEQEIWKMDTGTESSIRDDLKQLAIEEGTWSEKRDKGGYVDQPVEVTIVFVQAAPQPDDPTTVDVTSG